jgi:hypothetical protein
VESLLAISSRHWTHLWASHSNTHTSWLRSHSSEWLRHSSAFAFVVIFEALGDTPIKRHRLVTLGGFCLLDGLGVVFVELSVKTVEEPRSWLWEVCAYLTGAAKVTLVKLRYWVNSCPLGSKIKPCLGREASESLNSTSTWIRGDRRITDTTG